MGIEIERKFLVDHDKWLQFKKPEGTHYRQGYMLDEVKRTVRIRVAGNHSFITIKGISVGITRKEYEYEIPVTDAIELLDGFTSNSVEKIRYKIPFEGKLWEVDVFHGDNEGLIVAEIELRQEDEQFQKPDWVATEVSDDERYFNSNLSKRSFKTWNNK
ncbi:CYTH domain-containing protein [Mucilaginibacter sp. X4EP1]|uniref:CYTH domain-containing protein n=1 Tax=Mucilaginibacter sp. X4EP1 TaxID=2723092 RepID=UPI002166F64C|nr:CYTH domain-containing protein [Mucilaginibacter sp. X4EP1]MCS3812623.1 CYTH domain-containing protein [Mucilaginibacter sp. X4EP1]